MPKRIKRACRQPGCPGTTIHRSGYCEKHQETEGSWKKRQDRKGNRHQRGYGTAWQKLRKEILQRDRYLCQSCRAEGRLQAANVVDHIINKASGGTDDPGNLQALCQSCHAAKTGREGARASNRRGRGG
ncbi:HNH endonuclease [Candidatus Sororendozoicomonas aggregata]|uniref:HNH endonuclease n=1 Tax=Candidatus Sororendozoicomonas aggregata TaxID=3073239 RepID=UPI002ED6AA04